MNRHLEESELDDLHEFMYEGRAFRSQMLSEMATQTTEVKNIVRRLDLLNGSVARHEQAIADIRTAAAVEVATDKARITAADKLRSWVQPLIVALIASILAVIGAGLLQQSKFSK